MEIVIGCESRSGFWVEKGFRALGECFSGFICVAGDYRALSMGIKGG